MQPPAIPSPNCTAAIRRDPKRFCNALRSRRKGRTARSVRRTWSSAVPSIIGDASLLRAFSCLGPFPSAVLAVSGGPDSMALMVLAERWLNLTGHNPAAITIATVDHGLRPESKEEAAFVAAHARDLGFSHATIKWTGG